jgi:hypothetical protein
VALNLPLVPRLVDVLLESSQRLPVELLASPSPLLLLLLLLFAIY